MDCMDRILKGEAGECEDCEACDKRAGASMGERLNVAQNGNLEAGIINPHD